MLTLKELIDEGSNISPLPISETKVRRLYNKYLRGELDSIEEAWEKKKASHLANLEKIKKRTGMDTQTRFTFSWSYDKTSQELLYWVKHIYWQTPCKGTMEVSPNKVSSTIKNKLKSFCKKFNCFLDESNLDFKQPTGKAEISAYPRSLLMS